MWEENTKSLDDAHIHTLSKPEPTDHLSNVCFKREGDGEGSWSVRLVTYYCEHKPLTSGYRTMSLCDVLSSIPIHLYGVSVCNSTYIPTYLPWHPFFPRSVHIIGHAYLWFDCMDGAILPCYELHNGRMSPLPPSLPPYPKKIIIMNKDMLIVLPLKVYINSERVLVHKGLCSSCPFTHVCTSALALLSLWLHEANIQPLSLKPRCKLVSDRDNGCSKTDHQFTKERCRFVSGVQVSM